MPTLDWIGKKAVVNHHKVVPFNLLQADSTLSIGDSGNGNLLVEGDNLVALKALLPYYAGRVDCIYIDPPYNTGNEDWSYNDNVNSPEIAEWLGRVVGNEAEDLSRHDKWLCMMYPRLQLLKDFLSEDGAIFISIDDNEVNNLRYIMDEIFGPRNFIATIAWQKIYTIKNSAKYLSVMHDYVMLYARRKDRWQRNLRPRDEGTDEDYDNPDDDPNGPWISHALQSRNRYSKGTYAITCPSGRLVEGPPSGTYWRLSEASFWKKDAKGTVWWGKEGNNSPRIKEYLKDVKSGVVPATWWTYQFAGANSGAKVQLRQIVGDEEMFVTPKPVELVRRILELATRENSIVMDTFAGSGVTGHAVLEANKADGGRRKFILVEMKKDICRKVTAHRLTRVIKGYQYRTNKGNLKDISGLGGSFLYCTLSKPLFDAKGRISDDVDYQDLARHVYFCTTGEPLPSQATSKSPLIGIHNDCAIYLLFNGILGDKSEDGGNILTRKTLSSLPLHHGPRIVYANGCTLSHDYLQQVNIVFHQIPYEVRAA